jgi:ATP synthase protein I
MVRRNFGGPAADHAARPFSGKLMADDAGKKEPPNLDAFSERLEQMRGQPDEEGPRNSGAAWGRALRASSDLLAGLLVGGLIGWGLDRWLQTSPWFLLAGLLVGFLAGLRSLWRSMNG